LAPLEKFWENPLLPTPPGKNPSDAHAFRSKLEDHLTFVGQSFCQQQLLKFATAATVQREANLDVHKFRITIGNVWSGVEQKQLGRFTKVFSVTPLNAKYAQPCIS